MKPQLGRITKTLLMFVAFAMVVLLYGLNVLALRAHHTTQTTNHPNQAVNQPTPAFSNAITTENVHMGTTDWQIPVGNAATTDIQAYASTTSVSPGQRLSFFVSTQQTGTPYAI